MLQADKVIALQDDASGGEIPGGEHSLHAHLHLRWPETGPYCTEPSSDLLTCAGLQAYRDLARRHPSFRERSETTDLICEISLQPWESFKPDGVILFRCLGTLIRRPCPHPFAAHPLLCRADSPPAASQGLKDQILHHSCGTAATS